MRPTRLLGAISRIRTLIKALIIYLFISELINYVSNDDSTHFMPCDGGDPDTPAPKTR